MALPYSNNVNSGYDIAERFWRRGPGGAKVSPAVLRRAWFADLPAAEAYMACAPQVAADRRIISCQTGHIVAWRGLIHQVDPHGAAGKGENALSLSDWLGFVDEA